MTPKGHRVIRDRRDILYYLKGRFELVYDPKRSWGHQRSPWPTNDHNGHGDPCRSDLVYVPKWSQGHRQSHWPTLWPQMSRWPLWSVLPSIWPQKVTGLYEVAVTYIMTQKGQGDLYDQFDLFYVPKRSQGNKRSPWPTWWPQRSRWPLWSVWSSLWPQNFMRSTEVTVTYFMIWTVKATFVVGMN